jgi:hypothetical protein
VASRASPTGVSGDSAAARATARPRGHPDDERPGQAEQHELAAPQPQRGQRVVILDVGAELPGRGLPQDHQPGQRDQPGQHPPAHRLRGDGPLNGGRVGV